MPSFVTHYHRAGRRPFASLSDLGDATEPTLAAVLADLGSAQEQALSHRRFGPRYMALRRATEARARSLFVAAGGRPERSAPHYFVLGESAWFAGLYADAREVRLDLDRLPSAVTSFTYADSITALGLGEDLGLPVAPPPHGGRVYRLEQLADVVARHGLPGAIAQPAAPHDYDGHQRRPVDQYLEVQLWSDEPVRAYLSGD